MSQPPVPPPDPIVRQAGRPRTAATVRGTCRVHGDTDFYDWPRGRRCRRCVGEHVTRRLQKVKRTLVEEHGGACCRCGYARTPYNLHFHHVDPSTKSFGVSVASGKSLAAFRAEAAKCVLLCANCHGEVEAGLVPSPPLGSRWRGPTAGSP